MSTPATDAPAPLEVSPLISLAFRCVLTSYQETQDKRAESPESEEPQNPLTKKFTEGEWKALKELRVCHSY